MALLTSFGFSPSYGGLTPAAVLQNQAQVPSAPSLPGLQEMLETQLLLNELCEAMEELMQGYQSYASNSNSNSNAYSVPSSNANTNSQAPAGNGPKVPMGTPTRVATFIQKAEAQEGKPYVFGAAGPNAFDCSGLVNWALNQAGVKVPRLTADGYMNKFKDSRVDKNDLKPGDLIFYHSKNDRGIPDGHATHIEIYIGNGMTVGAESTKLGIKTQKVNWKNFIGAERVPGLYN